MDELKEKKKYRMRNPTIKQRKSFELYMKSLVKNEPRTLGSILLEAGYTPAQASSPTAITTSRGWEFLKKELDGEGAKSAFNELVSATNEDKRTRLASAIEITKIQGGYPAQENKVIGIFGNLGDLQKKDDRPEDITGEDSIPSSSGTEESSGV